MRSVIYGAIIAVFLASAGTVQAANDLDGKALFCTNIYDKAPTYPFYGLVFYEGKVERWHVSGYSKTVAYKDKKYYVRGTQYIWWRNEGLFKRTLDRHTLIVNNDICAVSSPKKISQKLDRIIAAAKKENKI
jgi:hypothetical protein